MSSPYRVLGKTLLPLLRWRIDKVEGLENLPAGGFILVANHQSWSDSAMAAAAIHQKINKSIRFIAQSSKWRFLGGIPINEYDKRQVLDVAYGYLKVGHPIIIFPEGNSNRDPELRTGRTGAARLALRSGFPVVPMGLQGTSGVKLWQSFWWYISFWKPCRVVIGQPITFPKTNVDDMAHEDLMKVTNTIMDKISAVSGKPYIPGKIIGEKPNRGWVFHLIWKVFYPMFRPKLRISGTENLPAKGPYIIVGNHQNYLDPPALAMAVHSARRVQPHFLTKASVARAWKLLLGPYGFKALGMVPLDTEDKSLVLQAAEAFLRRGGVLGIFPEGHRNKPPRNEHWRTTFLKGKTGTARLVLSTGVPVIPVGIKVPDGFSIFRTLVNTFQPWKLIHITFGPPVQFPPVSPTAFTKTDLEEMTRTMMRRIGELCGKQYPY